ncbi:Transmembrane and coiled-coil domain-containing protein 4 [Portunus trituberculatus]|uniref:Transmembrane and coiled-coil domain-containing protein 4 n=1 Tax=Portunus trituberculatus TaxID=210409 RepID=A0A5B7EPV8_PORTR|nr:Transmembrane and coiled-coil domain-containing protein 4 [Portunus trituberculatus]
MACFFWHPAGGAAAISSTAGVAVVGSMFGAAGAGLTGFKMQKRIGDVEEFAFDYLTDGSHLHITIAISGWLTKEGTEEFSKPWLRLYHSREQYCLRYESQYLLELGKAMDYLLQFALSMAVQETLKYTILAGIISAITWPTSLLTLASVIDNPWGVCCRRSAQVGKQLAEVLLQGQHGRRPVTLIGFSLGARVIYYCLQDVSGMRPSSSDSMLFCGHNAPLARSRSSDDLLISRSSTLLDHSESPLPEENTKPRSLSSYDFASRKCVPLKVIGPQGSFSQDKQSRSLVSSTVAIDQAGMSRSLGEADFKEQVTSSKGYFDIFSRKPQPSTGPAFTRDKNTLAAQEKFKRRTVSSGNLFPTKPGTSGRKELSRTASQDQPRQSIFQIFSKKQERIDEA